MLSVGNLVFYSTAILLAAAARKPRAGSPGPTTKYNEALEDFARARGLDAGFVDQHQTEICREMCNNKTTDCIIKFKNWTKTQADEQAELDQIAYQHLNKLDYIRHSSTSGPGPLDLDVKCLHCSGHTEGSLCQHCVKGYYDKFHVKRIDVIKNVPGPESADPGSDELREKILRTEIECQPCGCSEEGSHSYVCQQMAAWTPEWHGKKFVPSEHTDMHLFEASNATLIETGLCDCKKGYKSSSCGECDLEEGVYEVRPELKELWRKLTEAAGLPEIKRNCIPICHSKYDCNQKDAGGKCVEGHCICSWEKFGPNCEYEKKFSAGPALRFNLVTLAAATFLTKISIL